MDCFKKEFVGIVSKSSNTYKIQEALNVEGYFMIKATPLGAHMCLLEENNPSDISELVKKDSAWMERWFDNIHPWTPDDVDREKIDLGEMFWFPCHAWNPKFFKFLSGRVGEYISSDIDTEKHNHFDVTRFLIKKKFAINLNEVFNVEINDNIYCIMLLEDFHGRKQMTIHRENDGSSGLEEDDETRSDEEDGVSKSGSHEEDEDLMFRHDIQEDLDHLEVKSSTLHEDYREQAHQSLWCEMLRGFHDDLKNIVGEKVSSIVLQSNNKVFGSPMQSNHTVGKELELANNKK
ncbi:unnamed protein product [Lathyrus sativus]|nr:unnamed protein product [Lathyrus sativus]